MHNFMNTFGNRFILLVCGRDAKLLTEIQSSRTRTKDLSPRTEIKDFRLIADFYHATNTNNFKGHVWLGFCASLASLHVLHRSA